MTKITDIPAIRFKGFSDTWEQRKVTEIGKIYIGLVTTMTKHYTDEGTLLIRNSDIKDGKFEFGDNPIYLEKTFAEKNETRMHQIGDVITVHTGDVGTSAVITENEAKSIGFATIVTRPNPKIIDSNYLCSFLNTDKHKKWAVSISTGDGRTNYNLGDYFELVVPVPSIAEQKKIASYIQKLNRLITLHQRKYDKLTNVKKSMLEKMFPQNGSNAPEIRFKGFTEAWEQRKVSDVAKIIAGGTPSTKENSYWEPKEIPWLSSGEVHKKYITFTDDMISQIGMNNSSAKMVAKDSVLIALAGQGKTRGTVAINRIPLTTNQSIAAMTFNENFIPEFVFYNLENRYDELRRMSSGDGSRGGLNKQLVGDIEIPYTEKKEQERIGSFFESLDRIITLHQRELEKLKNLKKACLEKMFV